MLEKEHAVLKLSQALITAFYACFAAFKSRVAILRSKSVVSPTQTPTKDDMKVFYEYLMVCLRTGIAAPPPIDASRLDPNEEFKRLFFHTAAAATVVPDPKSASVHESSLPAHLSTNSSLLPPPPPIREATFLTIHIVRMGIKDAMRYVDPFLTVSLVDRNGQLVEPSQDTPCSRRLKPLYVDFGIDVHIQTPVESVPEGSALVLEFKHFKASKQKISTRCFGVLEMNNLDAMPTSKQSGRNIISKEYKLELCKKPTDFKRAKCEAFTVKPLYLEMKATQRIEY